MSINWYPGHIAKAQRKLKEQLKLVDTVFEVIDARLPLSSRYENLEEIIGNKPRLIVLNKSDLANPESTAKWIKYTEQTTGLRVISSSAAHIRDFQKDNSMMVKEALELGRQGIEKLLEKGMLARPVRTMVIGMPNVGKSSIINKLIKTSKVRVGAKAGVTRAAQWVRIHPKLDLLDTPGIIPMKLSCQESAVKLAIVNSVGEASYDRVEVAKELIKMLYSRYREEFCAHYKLNSFINSQTEPTIADIAESRNLFLTGAKPDIDRCASLLLSDFRHGRTGRMTLEDAPL